MKKPVLHFFLIALFFATQVLQAQISGSVFRDFNGNGQRDSSGSFAEPFVSNITVKATLANNNSFTVNTNNAGSFTFTAAQIAAGVAARIEFLNLAKGDYAAAVGTGNASNVQFAKAPSSSLSFGISAPDDFWNNVANPDPTLMVVQHPRGTYNGYNAGRFSVLQINNSTNGPNPATGAYYMTIDTSKRPARLFNTGTIFGLAYQKKQERFFMSATLKRTFGFGTQGPGGVYFLNKSGSTWTFGGGFNLQSVLPSNSLVPLDFGTVNRVTTPVTDDNYISGTSSSTNKARDNDAFAKVGTMSFGGIDADANTDSIYMVNLFQKRLLVLNGSAASASLNGATGAALSSLINAYDLTTLPGYPATVGAGNNSRPYGIKIYKGRGYIGVVNDGMATQSAADLKGYIISFDTKNIAAGFTTHVTINFNLYRGDPLRVFKPWVTTWSQAGGTATTNPKFCAQPMIADIEFNEDGSMDIAIRDRWGDQNAVDYDAWPSATNTGLNIEQGDVLHACKVGNGWVLEGTAGSCVQPIVQGNPRVAPYNPGGFGNSYNNTGREFYGDVSGDNENESAEGTLAKLMGSQTIVTSTYDPIGDGVAPSGNYWYTQGLHWNNCVTGKKTQMARTAISGSMQVSKVNGIGDIEFVTEAQPVQIGNLVWNDGNGNGLQDAGENGIANVQVTLRSPGLDGVYNTADDQTSNTITNATGNYFFDFSNITFTDTRKPATWTAVNGGILPGFNYRLEVDTAQAAFLGHRFTQSNALGNSLDHLDNDGVLSGNLAIANFNTNFVSQDIDFGFKNLTTISGFVWDDKNSNGLQNLLEPGLLGVVATLYDAANNIVGVTPTDSSGHFTIQNVPAGNGLYVVFSNLPLGGSFTLQFTGGVNANNNSKVDNTGRTNVFSIAPGQNLSGFDAGIKGLNTPLPITLLNFGVAKTGGIVALQWQTTNEQNSRSFIIERCADAANFITINSIPAAGNSSREITYYAKDISPLTGKNYYRLGMVSIDGAVQYSPIKLVSFNKIAGIEIFPNPANSLVNIAFPDTWVNKTTTVYLYNQLGQPVLQKQLLHTMEKEIISLNGLPTGTYMLKAQQNDGTAAYKKIRII